MFVRSSGSAGASPSSGSPAEATTFVAAGTPRHRLQRYGYILDWFEKYL